ncbi:putative zinc finger protein [Novymonas esmeraldas]|uniref:Zinc finger protein n=1 Tax=Novymonas esmeraldas TaxID=1808958 RepID=A0AAW0F520_9TRYP
MSLDCEGEDGGSCLECGDFDFLPYTCPWCSGTFCAAHATCHHVPTPATRAAAATGARLADAAGGRDAVLCAPPPPPETAATLTTAGAAAPAPLSSTRAPHHRCVVCQSALCALAPCPQCGDCYCAAHRFHGHGDAAPRVRQQSRRTTSPHLHHQPEEGRETAPLVAVLCAPYTSAHPLVLAPVGYRSRRMDALALIFADTDGVVADGRGDGSGVAPGYCVGVCSLVLATEMSVGQLRDQLVAFLQDVPAAADPTWSRWVSRADAALFSVAPADLAATDTGAARLGLHRVPPLSLVPLPVEDILRAAPLKNATVVLRLSSTTDTNTNTNTAAATTIVDCDGGDTALRGALAAVLYGSGAVAAAAPAPTSPEAAAHHRDVRVKALATRLRLQFQQHLRRAAAPAQVSSEDADAAPGGTAGQQQQQGTSSAPSPPHDPHEPSASTAGACESADAPTPLPPPVWPFRQARPLNSFYFFNTKMSPCGVSAIRPAAAPRIVVALFVADAALPAEVRPMCVALGRDWPLARVVDRLREEAAEQQLALHPEARSALALFSLYRLGNGAAVSGGAGGVVCVWDGRTPAPSCPPLTLQSADVLLLCPADAPGAVAAVQAELQQLSDLSGRAKTALRADQVKKCAVM